MRTHGGDLSHKDYSSKEYEFAVCSRGGENSPGIFLRNIYTLCVVTGVSSLTRTVPYGSHIHRVLPRGENSPGIFLQNIYTSCVVKGVSSFTWIIPLRNIHTPCVVTRASIRRVYSYTE